MDTAETRSAKARVVWENLKTGYFGMGDPIDKSMAEQHAIYGNVKHRGTIYHWVVDTGCEDDAMVFPITNSTPVRVDPKKWPIVARGDGAEVLDGVARACSIIVRQHEDGRTIAEAAYVVDGREDVVEGKLGNFSDEGMYDYLPLQINVVADYLKNSPSYRKDVVAAAVRNALASLPPVDLE